MWKRWKLPVNFHVPSFPPITSFRCSTIYSPRTPPLQDSSASLTILGASLFLLLAIASALAISLDAERRNLSKWGTFALILIFFPISVIIWFLIRNRFEEADMFNYASAEILAKQSGRPPRPAPKPVSTESAREPSPRSQKSASLRRKTTRTPESARHIAGAVAAVRAAPVPKAAVVSVFRTAAASAGIVSRPPWLFARTAVPSKAASSFGHYRRVLHAGALVTTCK